MDQAKLAALIKEMPNAALPFLLSTIVKLCVDRKVYGSRKVADIVATLEAKSGGNES